jgi:hypothetical protein
VNWPIRPGSELRKTAAASSRSTIAATATSGKLYDAAYEVAIMAGDVIALMDHLESNAPM